MLLWNSISTLGHRKKNYQRAYFTLLTSATDSFNPYCISSATVRGKRHLVDVFLLCAIMTGDTFHTHPRISRRRGQCVEGTSLIRSDPTWGRAFHCFIIAGAPLSGAIMLRNVSAIEILSRGLESVVFVGSAVGVDY